MNALAKWVMVRPRNAILSVAIFSIIPLLSWIAATTIGLVVLCKGLKSGLPICIWGCLLALTIWVYQGDATALIVFINIILLAWTLRKTILWSWVLLIGSFSCVLNTFLQPLIMSDPLREVTTLVQKALISEGMNLPKKEIMHQSVVVLSFTQVVLAVFSLFLARKWQAELYNPGGLRRELYTLRLPIVFSSILGIMALAGEILGRSFFVLYQAAIPALVLPAVALVHYVLEKRRIGTGGTIGLIGFHLVGFLVLNIYFVDILVILSFIDSFLNIRGIVQDKLSNSSNKW